MVRVNIVVNRLIGLVIMEQRTRLMRIRALIVVDGVNVVVNHLVELGIAE
jgi:hypothetical protein